MLYAFYRDSICSVNTYTVLQYTQRSIHDETSILPYVSFHNHQAKSRNLVQRVMLCWRATHVQAKRIPRAMTCAGWRSGAYGARSCATTTAGSSGGTRSSRRGTPEPDPDGVLPVRIHQAARQGVVGAGLRCNHLQTLRPNPYWLQCCSAGQSAAEFDGELNADPEPRRLCSGRSPGLLGWRLAPCHRGASPCERCWLAGQSNNSMERRLWRRRCSAGLVVQILVCG